MRNACRPMGRFFCLLMMMTATLLPSLAQGQTSGPAMTQVIDTLYRADGTVAAGMVMISWPAFTTADGKAVAAGSLSVPLGSGGAFSASLAPNTGAQPAGVYYRVVYQLTGQEPSSEYWVVPATTSIGIGSVRAKLMPPTTAAQVLTRDVADSNYVHVTGNSSVTGVVGFTASPQVPTPQNAGDAANKGYVDAANANLLAAPTAIGGTTPNKGAFTTLTASGGISGNLTGNVVGSLVGSVTGNLNGSVGAATPSTGAFTAGAFSGPITSTLATGSAPFSIASTTVVPNLNVSQLLGQTWTSPGAIGSTTPNTGAFTTAQTKYDPLLNAQVWGAIGNGSTDDTSAIASAATYACGKQGNVYLPPTGAGYKITSHILLTGDGCSLGGQAAGYGIQRTNIIWAAPQITLISASISTSGGTTTLTGTASAALTAGNEIQVFYLGPSSGLDGYRIGSSTDNNGHGAYTVTVGGTSFTATRPSSQSPYSGSYSAATTGYIANDSPIVIAGGFNRVHDLGISPAAASNLWQAAIHIAGAPGTQWATRSTVDSIENINLNCGGNYGIGIYEGDFTAAGSDQADISKAYIQNCHRAIQLTGGNTLGVQVRSLTSGANHIGVTYDKTSSMNVYSREMSENDIDWWPGIGGQLTVHGGDGEGSRILTMGVAGGSSASSEFSLINFNSRSRGVHPAGCSATTTSGSNIVSFNKKCAVEGEWIVVPGAAFYSAGTNIQVQVLQWVTPDGFNVRVSANANASVSRANIYWYIQDCLSASSPQNYSGMTGSGVTTSAGHSDIGFAAHCVVEGEGANQNFTIAGAGASGASLAVQVLAGGWYAPTGGNCGTLTGPFVACATNNYGNVPTSVSNAHIYDVAHSYGFYGTNVLIGAGGSGPYTVIGNQFGAGGMPLSYDCAADAVFMSNTFPDSTLTSPCGYLPNNNLEALHNTAGTSNGGTMPDYLGQKSVLQGATSGGVTLATQAAAGTWEWDWPTTAGTAGQCLLSQGGGGTAMTWGTCGSGSVNLASPSAIGSTTPNTGAFTTLTGQVVNGIPNAAKFSGADACAKINAAIASLDATLGGTVEARGFVASDLATACTTTLTIDRPVRLLLPEGVLLLGGNPGILINTYSSGVTIEGRGWEANYNPSAGKGTILRSAGPYPMIVDSASSQGTELLEVELDGHSTGTFGFLGAFAGGMTFRHVHVHNFQYTGLMALGGINSYYDVWSNNNGGDGMLVASDVVLEGNMQIALNGGSGVHMISSGAHFKGTDSDHNGLHGIYIDGRHRGDWTAGTKIIQPMVIMPLTNNAGGYLYYSANVGGTTGATAPAWNQTPNAVLSDGSVTWVNIGNNVAARTMDAIAQVVWIEGGYVDDNGTATPSYAGFVADNIRVEGDPVVNVQNSCNWINITGTWVSQAAVRTATITGIHLINCYESEVSGAVLLGSGYAGNTAPLTPDQGGLVVENSGMNTFTNITAHFETRSAVQLINARENVFTNLSLTYGAGNNSVPAPMNYAINIDANSSTNQFNMVNIDTGGNANSKGIYNRGSLTYVDNYQTVPGTTTALDDLQWATLTNAHGRQANVPVEFDVNGTPALAINSSGQTVVSGDLTVRDIPGHAYFVSQYGSIQAAINAAYGSGVVQGKVIDDRTAAYSGAGFYIPDSVTVQLAPVPYQFTSTVTHNNGNNTVTAAVVVEQGAHLVGTSTSTNHGTTISVASGFAGDIIATTSVGTGIGAAAQWWHWGSIENLNVDGTNQASGECVHVENMGETSKVHDLLVKYCYSNNIEVAGASATQSDIANITTNRSRNGSGIRFTNLAGVGKINGLSGDCNNQSLVSVQENAAGSLTILGLKAEAESTVCTGTVQDPVILLDGLTGFNDHVRVIGGYAFGTAQQNFAKFINGGNAIVEMEGVYITGYTNILNDTVRSYVAANSSSNSKQPFYYEPGGTTYANQAFTFTGGTFVQGSPAGTPTEIFGLTTGSQTLLAAAGNGDNSSILTGGIGIYGQNRTAFGTPPEIMARWGYRFLGPGLGYDTTNFDLVPAWNAGDTTQKNIGNTLTVCQKGGAVSCRWSNIYTLNLDTNGLTLNGAPVAPSSSTPSMNGTGAAGTSTNYARADHVHPSDTTRVATSTTVNGHALTGNVTVTANDVGVPHSISIQGPTPAVTGTGAMTALYSVTIPAGTFTVGAGIRCVARSRHTTGSASVSMGWKLGSTTYTYPTTYTTGSTGGDASIEIFTFSSLTAETVNIPWAAFGGTTESPYTGLAWSENVGSSTTLQFMFSVGNTDKLTGDSFYCGTVQ